MVQIPYRFFRERLISGLSVAKPTLDLLSERLEQASQKNHFPLSTTTSSTDYDFDKLKAPSRTSISELINRHGRFETAVLCATVENMACLCFLRQYGARGAVERTLPVLSQRAVDTFDYAYSRLSDKGYALVASTVKTLDLENPTGTPNNAIGKVVFAVQSVALLLLAAMDTVPRLVMGKDYLTLAIGFLQDHLGHTSARVGVNLSKCSARIARFQSSSRVFTFIIDHLILLAYMVIISCSIFFAFVSVYTTSPTEDHEIKRSDSNYGDYAVATEPTTPSSTVLGTSDWRTFGLQVVGFKDSPNIFPIEEELFGDLEIQVQVEGPSSSESEEDEDERAVENIPFTPYGQYRIPAELKGKMKETYDDEGLMNSPTPLAGNVTATLMGNIDTPEVEDVFFGLSEYYEERKRHYGSFMGSLSCTTSSSGNDSLLITTSMTFEHINKLNGPVLLTSASSTLFSETSFDDMHVGSEPDIAPFGSTEVKALDVELKEALDILTSPIFQEEKANLNDVKAKLSSSSKLYSHYHASSLDAMMAFKGETEFPLAIPIQSKLRPNATSKVKSNLAPHAPPFIPRRSTASMINHAEERLHSSTPTFWTPAPVVPVKIEHPPPRRRRSKSRRNAENSRRTIIPFRALDP